MSKAHREARATLEWSLEHEPSGFILLIGETGTGKTTLIISLLAQIPAQVRFAYVSNPKLGFDGLLRDIARQLGLPEHTERFQMLGAFDRYLEELAPNQRVVAVVDEAQALSEELLEDLRLFANREIDVGTRLHFVFAGQPDLQLRLCATKLRQLNERIGVRVLLNPLEATEARAYVDYRLAAFGGSVQAVFERGALECLLARSGGIPRRINVFCHNAMLRAYDAGETRVSLKTAHLTVIEVEDLLAGSRRDDPSDATSGFARRHFRALVSSTHGLAPALVAAMLAIAGMGSLYLWNSGAPRRYQPVRISAADSVGDAVIEYPDGTGSKLNNGDDRSMAGGAKMVSTDGHPNRQRPRRVRVQSGDTLLTIARSYLGSDDEVKRLIRANPQITNTNYIYPGEMLNLPASGVSRSVRLPTHETVASGSYDGE